jgi:hypothetical protein
VTVAGDPLGLVVGDLDGDGDLDLVTINGDGSVSVLIRSGIAKFDRLADIREGEGPGAIAAADLNADGRLDIVLVHSGVTDAGTGADDVIVLLGKGDGTFTKLVRPSGVNAQSVVIADFNGDHRLDLATANDGDHLSIFAGNGDGTFGDPTGYPTGALFSSGVATADLNRDGVLDLVTANSLLGKGRSNRTVSIVLGRDDGTFEAPTVYPVGGSQPILPVVADLNGDGAPDIVTPNAGPATGNVSVLIGLGDGGFSPAVEYPAGPSPHSLVVVDLDGDGHPDLVTGNAQAILFGVGDGTFEPKVDVASIGFGLAVSTAIDWDNDGKIDLIVIGDQLITLLFNAVVR